MKCSTRKCKREATGRIPVFVSLHSWKLKPYCEECLVKIALKIKQK